MSRKVSQEAMDWASEEIDRIKAWQEANPSWREEIIPLEDFLAKHGLPSRKPEKS